MRSARLARLRSWSLARHAASCSSLGAATRRPPTRSGSAGYGGVAFAVSVARVRRGRRAGGRARARATRSAGSSASPALIAGRRGPRAASTRSGRCTSRRARCLRARPRRGCRTSAWIRASACCGVAAAAVPGRPPAVAPLAAGRSGSRRRARRLTRSGYALRAGRRSTTPVAGVDEPARRRRDARRRWTRLAGVGWLLHAGASIGVAAAALRSALPALARRRARSSSSGWRRGRGHWRRGGRPTSAATSSRPTASASCATFLLVARLRVFPLAAGAGDPALPALRHRRRHQPHAGLRRADRDAGGDLPGARCCCSG